MGLFDNIFSGGGISTSSKLSSTLKGLSNLASLISAPINPVGAFTALLRSGEEAKQARTDSISQTQRQTKADIRQPVQQRIIKKETHDRVVVRQLFPDNFLPGIPQSTAATTGTTTQAAALLIPPTTPGLFGQIFGGQTPDLGSFTGFDRPDIAPGDAATIFENLATGQLSKSEAQKVLDARKIDLNPFDGLFKLSTTTKLALFGLAAIAVFQLSKRK